MLHKSSVPHTQISKAIQLTGPKAAKAAMNDHKIFVSDNCARFIFQRRRKVLNQIEETLLPDSM
jgi:DNA-binding FadR family transcriptional regulator